MTLFGRTAMGQDVHAITLGAHGLTATLLTYGAIVQDVRLDGVDHSLTLGSDTLADYEGAMLYHGVIVGACGEPHQRWHCRYCRANLQI